jgi:hypothetical protein
MRRLAGSIGALMIGCLTAGDTTTGGGATDPTESQLDPVVIEAKAQAAADAITASIAAQNTLQQLQASIGQAQADAATAHSNFLTTMTDLRAYLTGGASSTLPGNGGTGDTVGGGGAAAGNA